jgi:hypothetical protein
MGIWRGNPAFHHHITNALVTNHQLIQNIMVVFSYETLLPDL